MSRRGALAASLAAAAALTGCGDSADEPAPPPPPAETVDHLPGLPGSWSRYVDRPGGFAIGLPLRWKARRHGHAVVARSGNHLVAISITVTRSAAALTLEPADFARRAIGALPGFERQLRVGRPHEFETSYEAAQVRGRGEDASRVPERVTVIAIRRDRLAAYTVVVAANARRTPPETAARAEHVVRTLRGRPPRETSPTSRPCPRLGCGLGLNGKRQRSHDG